jgi:3-dehydroquinate dehydratase/shikimate dehydrogenase
MYSGAEYLDVESYIFSNYGPFQKQKLIISHHDFKETPQNLKELHRKMSDSHADIVKIATRANSPDDCSRMLDIIALSEKPTIGICMGPLGVGTRVLGPLFGGYLTFASLSNEKASAPGQLTVEELRSRWAALGYGPGRE